ncbi:MAG: hypothetical protein AABX38_05110 [Candidatus Micrarchaeota archaeon]
MSHKTIIYDSVSSRLRVQTMPDTKVTDRLRNFRNRFSGKIDQSKEGPHHSFEFLGNLFLLLRSETTEAYALVQRFKFDDNGVIVLCNANIFEVILPKYPPHRIVNDGILHIKLQEIDLSDLVMCFVDRVIANLDSNPEFERFFRTHPGILEKMGV